jgi:hypothetical protein
MESKSDRDAGKPVSRGSESCFWDAATGLPAGRHGRPMSPSPGRAAYAPLRPYARPSPSQPTRNPASPPWRKPDCIDVFDARPTDAQSVCREFEGGLEKFVMKARCGCGRGPAALTRDSRPCSSSSAQPARNSASRHRSVNPISSAFLMLDLLMHDQLVARSRGRLAKFVMKARCGCDRGWSHSLGIPPNRPWNGTRLPRLPVVETV